MVRLLLLAVVALAPMVATAQTDSAPMPYVPMPLPAPTYDRDAYAKAEKCMRSYATRFAATGALPQDVADAALEVCHKERSAAALTRMGGHATSVTIATLQADEPDLRRAAVAALLEARYPKAR